MTRLSISLCVLAATVGISTVAAQSSSGTYAQVSTVDTKVGGQAFRSLAFDAKAKRLYGASDRGLFWVGVDEAKPVWKGPMFKMDILHIEFAPELGRVFFTTVDRGVGYASVDALGEPKIFSNILASDLAYEPSRREVYVASRAPRVNVFDGATGEQGAIVDLPGWQAAELEAVPGRVFLLQLKTPGIFAIDAKTHELATFQTSEKVVTPVHLEADPSGRFVFAAYYQNIVAINAVSGRVVGRATMASTPAIAFDPGAGLLVATWIDYTEPVRVAAFKLDENGLSEVAKFKNPSAGGVGVEPTSNGFVQIGLNRFYIWSAKSN